LDAAIHALVLFVAWPGRMSHQFGPALNLQQLAWVFSDRLWPRHAGYAAAHPVAAASPL